MDSALPFNFLQKWNSEIELALEKKLNDDYEDLKKAMHYA